MLTLSKLKIVDAFNLECELAWEKKVENKPRE